jgi:hypothetical protein
MIKIPKVNEEYYCPCIDCIVKGVCTEVCDKFESYLRGTAQH